MTQSGQQDMQDYFGDLLKHRGLTPCYQESDIKNITNKSLIKLNTIKKWLEEWIEESEESELTLLGTIYLLGQIKGLISED